MESISIALRLRNLCMNCCALFVFLIIYYFIYGYENVMGSNIVNLKNILKDQKNNFFTL